MRPAQQERAIFSFFKLGFKAHKGLASPHLLGSDDFKIPLSICFGDDDWVFNFDHDASR
jgi:hypothetical protein